MVLVSEHVRARARVCVRVPCSRLRRNNAEACFQWPKQPHAKAKKQKKKHADLSSEPVITAPSSGAKMASLMGPEW